ncbi:MAG: SAM-dependent methyltransferase [Mycobacteriaceae bacterium]|nr:SAM-dependent methyltransferase [Mycobacteriaceae bacterium]
MLDEQKMRTDIPHSARIWNYWLGGKDNYEVDQLAGEAAIQACPDITTMAVQSRQFLIRSVRYLAAEAGIRQFLDIGTGLPTMQNTHEVAQGVAPEARVVYVDNDPLVLAHAKALLVNTTPEGETRYIDGDFNDPDGIVEAARAVLDFDKPVAVMFMGVLGHSPTVEHMRNTVSAFMDAVPSGSYLSLQDGSNEDPLYVALCEGYAQTGGVPYIPRSAAEIRACFDGLDMVDPGFVSITEWRPDPVEVGEIRANCGYGAVARKP